MGDMYTLWDNAWCDRGKFLHQNPCEKCKRKTCGNCLHEKSKSQVKWTKEYKKK